MGAFLGTLLGRHMAHEEEARDNAMKIMLHPMLNYLDKGPAKTEFTPEMVATAIKNGMKAKFINPHYAQVLLQHVESTRPQWEAAQQQRALAGAQEAAPKPSDTPPFQGFLGPQAEQNMSPVSPAMKQQAQSPNPFQPQASGAATQGLQPAQPPGMPPPPFASGAGPAGAAAPEPPNPVKEIVAGAQKGGVGFGGPTPTAPTPAPAPRYPWQYDRTPAEIGASIGEQEGAAAAGILRAQQGVNWEQAQKMILQLKSNPAFDKLPPLQQSELIARAMGIQGQISNMARPMNLPASTIFGGEIPAGSLTVAGQAVDPEKWYRQQQDVTTGDIRYVETTPKLLTRQVSTSAGPVLAEIDPRGKVVKVTSAINGAPIIDPSLLAQVTSNLSTREALTPSGDVVTLSSEGSRVSQKGGAAGAAASGVPGGRLPTPPAGTPPAGAGIPTPPGAATGAPPIPVNTPAMPTAAPRPQLGGRHVDMMTPKVRQDMALMGGPNGAMDMTMRIIKDIRDNADILDNPLVAKAIMFQADPKTGDLKTYFSGKYLETLEPEARTKAQKMAADVTTAMEHINTIRRALNAQGFRGEDAFGAMIAQAGAGRLLLNPGVLRNVLDRTLETLGGQREVIQQTLNGGKPGATAAPGGARKSTMPEPPEKQAVGGYIIGHKYGGLTYQGGDPNKRTSWK